MKRIVAFCFFPAFVPVTNGGQSRLFHFYSALSRWFHITLITSTHLGVEEEVVRHGLNFVERRIPKDAYFSEQYEKIQAYSSGGDLSAPVTAACGKFPTLLHKAYLEEYEKADLIFHDFPFTIDYDLFAGIDKKIRVYNAHNCESILYRQLHPDKKSAPIQQLVDVAEKRMLECADFVFYCNDQDLDAFRKIAPDATYDSIYVPNGTLAIKKSAFIGGKEYRAVFMGSGHPPNVKAAEYIVEVLAPALPEVHFDIIGSCLKEGRYSKNVSRHGTVGEADKVRILSRANIALNPMDAGSGSNVKVLEYFAQALPVLATVFGMRGINAQAGKEYLEASLEDFLKTLKDAFLHLDELDEIGQNGYSLALKHYTWDQIAKSAAMAINLLLSKKINDEKKCFVLALNDYDSFAGVGGGSTRTSGLYKAVKAWRPVIFLTFSHDGTLRSRWVEQDIKVVSVPMTFEHQAELGRLNAGSHISVDDIVASRHCLNNLWLRLVYQALRKYSSSIVIEHCYMVDLPVYWNDRFVYSSQNNETILKSKLLENHPRKSELVLQVERVERLAVERSAATVAVSNEDAHTLVQGKRTSGAVVVVRNGSTMPVMGGEVRELQLRLGEKIGEKGVVFLGSAHLPNVEAALFIVDHVAAKCPDIKFNLIGSVCSEISNPPANVILWGVVDDATKSAIMQTCKIALNPMTGGSGSNVKLSDYLGNGLFVITTDFGRRGYPSVVDEHLRIVDLDEFSAAVRQAVYSPELYDAESRRKRLEIFSKELAMQGIAQRFVEFIRDLGVIKKKVLYVAYRYTSPAKGGAELNIEKFVQALGYSGKFSVDVVAPEISDIRSHSRFSENYSFAADSGVPTNIPNIRFARFPVDAPDLMHTECSLRKAWTVQPKFEKVLSSFLCQDYKETGLTWGWGDPEGEGKNAARWAFLECGFFLEKSSQIRLQGFTPQPVTVSVYQREVAVGGPWYLEGSFSLEIKADAGEMELISSTQQYSADPRPLAMRISSLIVNDNNLNLSEPTLMQKQVELIDAPEIFNLLDSAAEETRFAHGVNLTDIRGPRSVSLENFIASCVKEYDLVVTHNNVFRPAVFAIQEAKKNGVPSILVPHAHLDDDFYHFPDLLESARNASLVLAVPKPACSFLEMKGCNVRYLPAGCDASEKFTLSDVEAFSKVYKPNRPFVLVLGRKAGAKGYDHIINAVECLSNQGIKLQVVMIGPDDDGVPINSTDAVYLGMQPRDVVRGALLSCLALCNMSSSESFGIVLLEAWLAGKAVIANKHCVAFHDMAVHGENALLVDRAEVAEAIKSLYLDSSLSERLASNGRVLVDRFDWGNICSEFVEICDYLSEGVR